MYSTGAILAAVKKHTDKCIAKVPLTLTKRAIETLDPAGKSWIAWDDKFTGFGVHVQPSGTNTKNPLDSLSSEYAA